MASTAPPPISVPAPFLFGHPWKWTQWDPGNRDGRVALELLACLISPPLPLLSCLAAGCTLGGGRSLQQQST